jgi:hypothetical protein
MNYPTLRELSPTQPPPRVPDHDMLRCIGRGGYGEVWLARNTLGTFRAVKFVFQANFDDSRPFEREYTGIRKFEPVSRSHPGLVDILQVGRNDAEGYFYYVMELADDAGGGTEEVTELRRNAESPDGQHSNSPTLRDPGSYIPRTLSREKIRRGRIPAGECIDLGLSLSGALAELHRHGLIHRDIKPANIIFVGGVAKLADIGLVTDAAEPLSYVGTEGFIPPEGPSSQQADIFSLGKVLYEMAMGKDRLDFPEPATGLEELPDRDQLLELNSILLKACQPDRRLRYSSAAEMRDELDLLQQGRSIRAKRNARRRLRWMTAAAATVLMVTLAAFTLELLLDSHTEELQGESSTIHPALAGKISPRPSALPERLIDLSAAYNAPLTESWYAGPDENTLAALPRGLQNLGGIDFDVRGLVQLAGREINHYERGRYPLRIPDIPIGRWVQRLHFLHGAVSEVKDGMTIGAYRIHYNTGRFTDVPIVFGRNVRPLWQPRSSHGLVEEAALAWTGRNPATEARDLELRLYRLSWKNPWPAEAITAIEFTSRNYNSGPFLVALTSQDAELTEDQKQVSVSLVERLQDAAPAFIELPLLAPDSPFAWTVLQLNARPMELGGRYYDGFRFTAPETGSPDLLWAFAPRPAPFQSWFILPVTEGMKVGFEDYYHGYPEKNDTNEAAANDFNVQFLNGRKLEPGREYFIWFGGDTNKPFELRVALRFVPPGTAHPNEPGELVAALALPLTEAMSYHRHYCLGAIR